MKTITLTQKTRTLLIASVFALACGLGLQISGLLKPEKPHPLATLELQQVDGSTTRLSQYQNTTVLINFWATWCPPCIQEMPELNALYPELKQKNIELLGIAIDSPSNIREFLTKNKINYPLYAGGFGGSELATQLGNTQGGLPFTVLLNPNGDVAWIKLGRVQVQEIQQAISQP